MIRLSLSSEHPASFSHTTVRTRLTARLFFAMLLLAMSFLTLSTPSFASHRGTCSTAIDLSPNTLLRGVSGIASEVFRLELPTPGVLTLDALTPHVEANAIALELLPGECQGVGSGDAFVVAQSAAHLVLAVRTPGTWWLRLTTADPGRYRLLSHFIEAEVHETSSVPESTAQGQPFRVHQTYFLTSEASDHLEPETVDPDPDTLIVGPLDVWNKLEPETVDPDPDTLTAEATGRLLVRVLSLHTFDAMSRLEPETVDPDPNTTPRSRQGLVMEQILHQERVCGPTGLGDDHGDTLACATPFKAGQTLVGNLGNGWGDDVDLFALDLRKVTTLEVSLEGDVGIFGTLQDASGQRLATDSEHFPGGFTTTLGPGLYFIRVESAGTEGPYTLKVTARSR